MIWLCTSELALKESRERQMIWTGKFSKLNFRRSCISSRFVENWNDARRAGQQRIDFASCCCAVLIFDFFPYFFVLEVTSELRKSEECAAEWQKVGNFFQNLVTARNMYRWDLGPGPWVYTITKLHSTSTFLRAGLRLSSTLHRAPRATDHFFC